MSLSSPTSTPQELLYQSHWHIIRILIIAYAMQLLQLQLAFTPVAIESTAGRHSLACQRRQQVPRCAGDGSMSAIIQALQQLRRTAAWHQTYRYSGVSPARRSSTSEPDELRCWRQARAVQYGCAGREREPPAPRERLITNVFGSNRTGLVHDFASVSCTRQLRIFIMRFRHLPDFSGR
eukprot:SAG11_NODE_4795_length_1764_cov_1.309910_3_plen_179_part_00